MDTIWTPKTRLNVDKSTLRFGKVHFCQCGDEEADNNVPVLKIRVQPGSAGWTSLERLPQYWIILSTLPEAVNA
jgi:hypothetical protein